MDVCWRIRFATSSNSLLSTSPSPFRSNILKAISKWRREAEIKSENYYASQAENAIIWTCRSVITCVTSFELCNILLKNPSIPRAEVSTQAQEGSAFDVERKYISRLPTHHHQLTTTRQALFVIAFSSHIATGESEKCRWWNFNDGAYCYGWMASNNRWLARGIIYEPLVHNSAQWTILGPGTRSNEERFNASQNTFVLVSTIESATRISLCKTCGRTGRWMRKSIYRNSISSSRSSRTKRGESFERINPNDSYLYRNLNFHSILFLPVAFANIAWRGIMNEIYFRSFFHRRLL